MRLTATTLIPPPNDSRLRSQPIGRLRAICSRDPETPSMRLRGRLDRANAEGFERFVAERYSGLRRELVLDIRSLASIDNWGLATIVAISRSLREAGGHLRLRCSQAVAHRILDLSNALDPVLPELNSVDRPA